MITHKFQTILILAVVIYLLLIYKMLKDKVTLLKYTLLWLAVGMVLLVFAIFPPVVQHFANLFGIYADINFLFLALIAFSLMLVFSLTHIVSKQNENTKKLVQAVAILEKRINDLEEQIKQVGDDK